MTKPINISIGLLSLLPTGLFIWSNEMSCALIFFIAATALDFVSGVIKSFYCGTFQTSVAWDKGLRKFTRLVIAIIASYLLELIGGVGGFTYSWLIGSFVWLMCFWSVLEIVSVMENLDDMGLPVPISFIKYVRRNIAKECDINKKE